MPNAVSVTGSDVAQINTQVLSTLADGNAWELAFDQDLAAVKIGKNGNTIYAKNEQGRGCTATVRILTGGVDDKYLNALMQEWISDPSSFQLLTGMFVKLVGDGNGNIESNVYQCSGGVILKQPATKTATEGDTDQSVKTYMIRFGNCSISFQ